MRRVAIPFLLGAISGALGGLMGVGGGIVLVPLLVHVLDHRQHEAQGISLAFIIVTSLVAAASYYRHASVDVVLAGWLTLGAVPGVIAGSRLAAASPAGRLRVAFGIVVLLTGIRLLASPPRLPVATGAAAWAPPFECALGLVVGVFAGLLGVGGGTILVPILVLAQGIDQHTAQGTSLLMIIPVGLVGVWSYAKHRRLESEGLPWLLLGGAGGALAGSILAHRIQGPTLTRLFALFMLAVGIQMIFGRPRGTVPRSEATLGEIQ